MSEDEKKVVHIEACRAPDSKTYPIRIHRFFYRIPRISITIFEGYHTEEPNPYTGKTIEDAACADRRFTIACRPCARHARELRLPCALIYDRG